MERLRNSGKIVTIVIQAPEIPFSMREISMAVATNQADVRNEIRGFKRQYWDVRINRFLKFIDSILGVNVVNPTELFCRHEYCYAALDGKALYFDDDHISTHGASLLAPVIVSLE